ncbi:MAG: metal ABC transporter substrate-binding protein [bacterium]
MKRFALISLAILLAGCSAGSDDPRPVVATTTSYLECAVADLAGDQFRVARLLPPGSCPGHFDVSPSMLDKLADSDLLLRFQFQSTLDQKLHRFRDDGLRVVPVPSPEGLCLPASYRAVCRGVCRALCEVYPESALIYRERLARIEERMTALSQELKTTVEQQGLAGARVLASGHQAHFCRALGLDVVGTFTGREAAAIQELQACIRAGREADVRFVVANLQEGVQLADPLAQRLGAEVVVFSNFPSMEGAEKTFDALVRCNLDALRDAPGEPAP